MSALKKVLLLFGLTTAIFASNLFAICANSDGILVCDETLSPTIYESYALNSNFSISTNANNAHGLYNNNNGSWVVDKFKVVTNGVGAIGVYTQGSTANLTIGDNANIVTNGNSSGSIISHGVYAQGNSAITIGDNVNITTNGRGARAIWVTDNSSVVIGDNAVIATTGGDPYCGGCASTGQGLISPAIRVEKAGSTLRIGDNATISTLGGSTDTIIVLSGTALYIGDNALLTSSGNRSSSVLWTNAAKGNDANITVGNNAQIIVYGSTNTLPPRDGLTSTQINGNPYAIYSYYYGNVNIGNNSLVETYGLQSHAAYSYYSILNIQNNATIATYGDKSHAVRSLGATTISGTTPNTTITIGENSRISTAGEDTHALSASRQLASVTLGDNSWVSTSGARSYTVNADGGGNVFLGDKVSIFSSGSDSSALYALANSNITIKGDANIAATGNNSYAVYSNGFVKNEGFSKLNIDGDILSGGNGAVSLSFKDGFLRGSSSLLGLGQTNLSFDNSTWAVTKNSTLTNLHISNNAKVDLSNQNSSLSAPTTLFVENLSGDGGVFEVRFDAKNLISDTITINNSSDGEHSVLFNDKTSGSYSTDGSLSILVIEQNVTNDPNNYKAHFTGKMDIGEYTYNLVSSNGTFWLGSPGSVPTRQAPLNNAAKTSISLAKVNYLSNLITQQTLFQKMGEINMDRIEMDDVWVKTHLGKLSGFSSDAQIEDISYYGIDAGFDRITETEDGKIILGVTLGYSQNSIDYQQGDGNSKYYTIGGYLTYKSYDDFYVDSVLRYAKTKNNFNTLTSNGNEISGEGGSDIYSLSVEIGKKYRVDDLFIEPQAALSYANIGKDSVKSSNGLVTNIDSVNSIMGRVGVRVGYDFTSNLNAYIKTGYIKEFDGKVSYAFNNNRAQEYKINSYVFDNAIGLAANIDEHSLYFEGSYQKGDEFNSIKANLGYRYSF